MCSTYDEDLTENYFFQIIRRDYSDMLYQVIMGGCVICIPRAGSLSQFTVTQDDILGHVICPNEEMPENHFETLSGKHVTIHNRVITIEFDNGCKMNVNILFEETYYTQDFLKYKVLCVEHPLDPRGRVTQAEDFPALNNLRDCVEFLGVSTWSAVLTLKINNLLKEYVNTLEDMEDPSIQTLKDVSTELYTDCLHVLTSEHIQRRKAQNLTIALEAYVHHMTYKTLFDCITRCMTQQDAALNKMIRNSSDLQLRDLQVGAEFFDLIPKAKTQLRQIECHTTVLGKLNCLRKMMAAIGKDPESGALLATDDILPIVIFLIFKANIANWQAHLNYLKSFRFASNNVNGNEDEYLVTTLEAALVHVRMGAFCENFVFQGNQAVFYEAVASGDLTEVENILRNKETPIPDVPLCHPLCSCEKCQALLEISKKKNTPGVCCLDSEGRTPLHIAAMFGQLHLIEHFATLGAGLNAKDKNGWTPLHAAASKDHQRAVLLLVESGAIVNVRSNNLNTPLHICSGSGHLTCVNGLIFHRSMTRVAINAMNSDGDTPLHLAARWGFVDIVKVLLEHGADCRIANKRSLTPDKVTVNPDIRNLLNQPDDWVVLDSEPKETSPKVEKMLHAISCEDINLACFHLGIIPESTKQCHPLCSCVKCLEKESRQAPPNRVNMCNEKGVTALHKSVNHGNLKMVDILLCNKADANVQLKGSLATPLILACQQERLQIVVSLLKAGCCVDLTDSKGNTALHYACMLNNRRLVEQILMFKPNLNVVNKCGRTPMHEAKAKMALGIVDKLMSV